MKKAKLGKADAQMEATQRKTGMIQPGSADRYRS